MVVANYIMKKWKVINGKNYLMEQYNQYRERRWYNGYKLVRCTYASLSILLYFILLMSYATLRERLRWHQFTLNDLFG